MSSVFLFWIQLRISFSYFAATLHSCFNSTEFPKSFIWYLKVISHFGFPPLLWVWGFFPPKEYFLHLVLEYLMIMISEHCFHQSMFTPFLIFYLQNFLSYLTMSVNENIDCEPIMSLWYISQNILYLINTFWKWILLIQYVFLFLFTVILIALIFSFLHWDNVS